jgi:pyrophosphatase PpaX
MANFAPKEKVDELVNVWSIYKARFSDKMFLYPGILPLIEELKKAGLKLAVVTSQTEPEINLTRRCLGLEDIFDSWICSDHVTMAKPDPEPVLTALEQLKVETYRSIMIGDTFNDLEAGRRAGTYIGAVLWGFGDPQQLLSYHPDFVFKTVEDIYTLTQFVEINN